MKNFIKINRALAAEKKLFVVLCASLVCAMSAFAESRNVECGKKVTITATPKAGYHFVQWSDGDKNATRTIDKLTQAVSLTATFAADETTIPENIEVVDVNGDPVVLPVAHSTTLYYKAENADDCQQFVHWSDITDPTDPNYAINPRPFVYDGLLPTFTPVFETIIYNVTVNADDATHGDVTVTIVEP